MSFVSFEFFVFVGIVWITYMALPLRWQNIWILLASLTFFLSWGVSSLTTVLMTAVVSFLLARTIGRTSSSRQKKFLLVLAVGLAFGSFFVFRHIYPLKAEEVAFGKISLPIGLPFYVLQQLGYVIDVYRATTPPSSRLLEIVLFCSFFPQGLMGPIERFPKMQAQFNKPRVITISVVFESLFLISFGLFKKMVIADRILELTKTYNNHFFQLSAVGAWICLVLYISEIYCDFSGYTDIARGVARLFGFDITENFNQPYFSRNFGDFFARWNMSLMNWVKDYVYWPIALHWKNIYLAALITFFVLGMWHGFDWNHLVVSFYWFFLYVCYLVRRQLPLVNTHPLLQYIIGPLQRIWVVTLFSLTSLSLFARSPTEIFWAIQVFDNSFQGIQTVALDRSQLFISIIGFFFIVMVETFRRKNVFFNAAMAFILIVLTITFGISSSRYFIYMRY